MLKIYNAIGENGTVLLKKESDLNMVFLTLDTMAMAESYLEEIIVKKLTIY